MRGGFEQSDNAQAAVEVRSMLIVGQHVTDQANDKQQLIPNLAALSPAIGPVGERMAHRLDTAGGKQLYGLRKRTVEPVFGIIKQAIGFRRFLLRGGEKVSLEWTLVSTSYNLKRLFNLGMSLQRA